MTQHDPDVEALIEALKDAREYVSSESCMERIDKTLAKFAPKPAKVYVLPEWQSIESIYFLSWLSAHNINQNDWQELRELTATEAPAQKWNVPKWVDVPKDSNGWFDFTSENGITNHCGEQAYNAFCAKIITTNEVKD